MIDWYAIETLNKALSILATSLWIISVIQDIVYKRRERAMAKRLANLERQLKDRNDKPL